jgi:hypothetical protein
MMVMGSQQEQAERMEILRGLIERLSAPDLTLAEAEVLRAHLSDLLEPDKEPAACDQLASSPAFVPSRAWAGRRGTACCRVARDLDAGGSLMSPRSSDASRMSSMRLHLRLYSEDWMVHPIGDALIRTG